VLAVDARSSVQVFTFATCIGIGFGGGVVCLMAIVSNYFGTQPFASLAGLAVAVNTTGSAIAPILGGRLYDQGYGYSASFYVLAVWCFIAAVVLFVMRPPARDVIAAHPKELHAASRP
jgi:OFA family oxalate/formate antiporter-like MFS transporter